jgi:hypothetical protein
MGMIGEHLTDHDFAEGSEAYVRYCAGIAVMQFPYDTAGVHGRLEVEEHVEEINFIAGTMMVDAMHRIIKVSYPGEKKTLKNAEHAFAATEPAMREILSHANEYYEGRLIRLNEMFPILRPAAFLDPVVYRSVCHGKPVNALDLMDGFTPSLLFLQTPEEPAL